MIENYKGWEISLNWNENNFLMKNSAKDSHYNQNEKWKGVNLNGNSIYGSSLKETRHIIDYPNLHKE